MVQICRPTHKAAMRETKIECEKRRRRKEGGELWRPFPRMKWKWQTAAGSGDAWEAATGVEGMGKGMKRGWEITLTTWQEDAGSTEGLTLSIAQQIRTDSICFEAADRKRKLYENNLRNPMIEGRQNWKSTGKNGTGITVTSLFAYMLNMNSINQFCIFSRRLSYWLPILAFYPSLYSFFIPAFSSWIPNLLP